MLKATELTTKGWGGTEGTTRGGTPPKLTEKIGRVQKADTSKGMKKGLEEGTEGWAWAASA